MSQYDQNYTPPPYTPPTGTPPGQGMATASLVLGIISLVLGVWFGLFSFIFIVLSIVGIVLAVTAKKRNAEAGYPPGVATAGLVLNIIALALAALSFIACGICVSCLAIAAPFSYF